MKRSYETPETLNQRNRDFRQRMRDKGMKYFCMWVPNELVKSIKEMIDGHNKDKS